MENLNPIACPSPEMRKIRSILTQEPSDVMKTATLHQASPEPATEGTAEEVQWTWKRTFPQKSKLRIQLYSKLSITDQIAEELRLIGDGVYQEFINSCFGFLLRFDTKGVVCNAPLHYLFAHEVIKADAGPDELWFRVGGNFIRFSKYEYSLVTGLSFGPTTFDPSAEHRPPASGLFFRYYHGRNLTMEALKRDFTDGLFRGSPADALKVAKLLLAYFLLFGMDGRRKIDEWAWTLIEDDNEWETFMWGKHTYQILLRYLQRYPTVISNSKSPRCHIHGSVWAFLIWAFEAVPELGITCGVRTSDNVLPRCIRWRFAETQVDMEGFSDRQMEVHSMLEPSAEEQIQPYWQHMINDDLRTDVCYIHQGSTTPANLSSGDVVPVWTRQGSEASPARSSCLNSASPLTGKRKWTDPQTTHASGQEKSIQKELSMVRQDSTTPANPSSGDILPVCTRQGSEASPTRRSCSTGKRKRTDPQTTHASGQEKSIQKELSMVRQELALVQQELPSAIRQEVHVALKEILLRRSSPEARDPTVGMQCDEAEVGTPVVPRGCEKCKRVDAMVVTMGEEIDSLRREKLAAIKTIDELRLKQLEADKVVERLKRKNLEANKKILKFDKSVELSKVAVNKAGEDKLIFELNEKINEFKKQNLENERLVGVLQEKCKHFDTMVVEMGKEKEELRNEKLAAIHSVKELRLKQLEADKVVEELKGKNIEANSKILELDKTVERLNIAVNQAGEDKLIFELNEKINELKKQNLETERLVGVVQEKCKHFETMVMEMGKEIEELRHEKLAAISTVKELRQKQLETDKVVEELKRKNLEALKTAELYKIELAKAVELHKRRFENLLPKTLDTEVGDLSNLSNGVHMLASSVEGRNLNIPGFNGSTPDGVENVVVMSRGVRSTSTVTRGRGSGLSKKGTNDRNSVQPRTRKNNDAHTVRTSHGKQSGCNSHGTVKDNEHRETRASGNMSTEYNALNDGVSSDDSEDESCSDSKMDDLIASLRSEHLVRKWTSVADMSQALQHDEVLCMNAVCALYRHNIVARKSKRRAENGRFSPVDPMSECALAEYLIDGDRELRLRKLVSEVKKERPDVIGKCRKLATIYVEKLFQIYCAADDPFFGQS